MEAQEALVTCNVLKIGSDFAVIGASKFDREECR
jgi:hypothetical protein